MKRILLFIVAAVGLFGAAAIVSNLPVQGQDPRVDSYLSIFDGAGKVQRGYAIAPVHLNLTGKNPLLVGLGSYIVNAQGGCNDCHTCPSYKPGHNPFPPPFGNRGDGQFNDVGYLAGGVNFGPVTSANITPNATGKPKGLTLEQFKYALRSGYDPIDGHLLAVMPWPVFRNMTERDLDAIYAYLSAIPTATPPPVNMRCSNPGQ